MASKPPRSKKPRKPPRAEASPPPAATAPPQVPAPTSQGEEHLEGKIGALIIGETGCGVRVGDRRVALSTGVPGDRVRFVDGSRHGPPQLIKLLSPSPDRVEAPCAVLDRCGGCTFQAMDYARQLEDKRASLKITLRTLCEPSLIKPVIGLSKPFGFRTRLLMAAAPTKGGFDLGFYQRGSTDLVAAGGCPVQHPLTLAALAMVKQALDGASIEATSPRGHRGWLHGLGVRVDPASGATEVTLAAQSPKVPGGDALVRRLTALPGVNGLHLTVNPARSSYLFGESFIHLGGHRRTIFALGGQHFHLSPGAFFQTNHEGAERLAEIVVDMLPERSVHLADLYGGVGVFARLSQSRWERATVAESNPHAIEDLKAWLKKNPGSNLRAICGKVESVIDKVLDLNPDTVIIDPPRSGCHPKVISSLVESGPPLIIFVACGVEALVRDSRALVDGGYRIDRVESVDMFPHTSHLETVVRLVKDRPR